MVVKYRLAKVGKAQPQEGDSGSNPDSINFKQTNKPKQRCLEIIQAKECLLNGTKKML